MHNMQAMQSQLEKLKSEMEQREYEGAAGAGLVRIMINGAGDIKKLSIDPSLLNPSESETLSDLVIAAFSNAKTKWTSDSSGYMSEMVSKLKDFKLPF
jgi:DNA-binding YbaB/EbfC family protein